MLARVSTFEGGTADGIRGAMQQMQSNIGEGPPPGVDSTGFTMLADADGGRVMMIGLFENEEKMRSSEEALQGMDPPEGMGKRSSVDVYEVGAEIRM